MSAVCKSAGCVIRPPLWGSLQRWKKAGNTHTHTDIQPILITMCGSTGRGSRATRYRLPATHTCLRFRLKTHKHTRSGEYLLSYKKPHWFAYFFHLSNSVVCGLFAKKIANEKDKKFQGHFNGLYSPFMSGSMFTNSRDKQYFLHAPWM